MNDFSIVRAGNSIVFSDFEPVVLTMVLTTNNEGFVTGETSNNELIDELKNMENNYPKDVKFIFKNSRTTREAFGSFKELEIEEIENSSIVKFTIKTDIPFR